MKSVILDIEANDLLERVTELHCFVLRDPYTEELIGSYADQQGYPSIAEGLALLDTYDVIWGHNLIRYDRPALAKLTGYTIPWEKVRDSLIIAQFRYTNLKELDAPLVKQGKLPPDCLGKHTLKAWGYRLGVLKGTYGETNDFSRWTPEMQAYCEQDTLVTAKLIQHLEKVGAIPKLAIETEQELAEYLLHQETNGIPFDVDKAVELQATLTARREELTEKLVGIFGSWQKKGKLFIPKRDNKKLGYVKGVPVQKMVTVTFNPGSRQQVAQRLQEVYGWQPTKFTPSGQPEVDEDTLETLPDTMEGKKELIEYFMIAKRLGQLAEGTNAWLKLMKKNEATGMYHIHHACIQSGTVTHRASHVRPNMAQVPAVGKPYGEECRALFRVPPGWVQVGADASGLELRMLAHYMAKWDGGEYGRAVVEGKNEDGTDVHSRNRDALGLEGKDGRNKAKTFTYAFLYGAGDAKLGAGVPPTEAEVASYKKASSRFERAKRQLAKRGELTDDLSVAQFIHGGVLRERFLKGLPAIGNLVTAVKEKAKSHGYLVLLDGRRVPVRHQHAALNSLLQGSGAVVCKRWGARFYRRLREEFGDPGWSGKWSPLAFVHDEYQLAVRPEIADRVCQILIEEIRAVGVEFNLRCPLDGEAKVGNNWAETH